MRKKSNELINTCSLLEIRLLKSKRLICIGSVNIRTWSCVLIMDTYLINSIEKLKSPAWTEMVTETFDLFAFVDNAHYWTLSSDLLHIKIKILESLNAVVFQFIFLGKTSSDIGTFCTYSILQYLMFWNQNSFTHS